MSEKPQKWIVRIQGGRLKGPFTTQEVLNYLSEEKLSGEDEISPYPGADWISISKKPEFFDHLLKLLEDSLPSDKEKEGKTSGSEKDPSIIDAIDSGKSEEPSPFVGEEEPSKADESQDKTKEASGPHSTPKPQQSRPHKSKPPPHSSSKAPILEYAEQGKVIKKEKQKNVFIYTLLILLLLGLGLYVFLKPLETPDLRVHLREPQKFTGRHLKKEEKIKLFVAGTQSYFKDSFSHYRKAQDLFIQIIEGSSKNTEAWGLLCMTYLELWPYSYQDEKDFRIILNVSQKASQQEGELNSQICQAVKLFLRGQWEEAEVLTKSTLNNIDSLAQKTQLSILSENDYVAFLHYLRGRQLEKAKLGDLSAAIGYTNSASNVFKDRKISWIRAYLLEADLYRKTKGFSKAINLYKKILQIEPQHKIAKIQMGLLLINPFRKEKEAYSLLFEALHSKIEEPSQAPIVSEGYMGLSQLSMKRGEKDKALAFAQKSYAINPSNFKVKNLLVELGGQETVSKTKVDIQQLIFKGNQYEREGDIEAACAHYKVAFEKEAQAVAALKSAKCSWKLSFTNEAIQWLNKAILIDPNYIEAYITLADYYSQRYNFSASLKVLSKARSVDPQSHQIFRGFCHLYFRTNNAKAAIKLCKQALKLYESDVETFTLLSKAYIAVGDYDNGFKAASKAIEIDSNSKEAHVAYALALRSVKGVETAVNYLKDLAGLFPNSIEYLLALGDILLEEERFSEAQVVFEHAQKKEPKNKKIFLGLGKAFKYQREEQNAFRAFLRASVLDPSDPLSIFEAGLLYLEAARFYKDKDPSNSIKYLNYATEQFQRVININSRYPRIYLHLAETAYLKGEMETALNYTRKEKVLNPKLTEIYLLNAEIYLKMKKYTLCAREYQKAVQLSVPNSSIYIKIARCHRLSGRLDISIEMIEKAKRLESGNFEVYKEMGLIYQTKGEKQKAIQAYEDYLHLNPGAPDADQIRLFVRKLSGGN